MTTKKTAKKRPSRRGVRLVPDELRRDAVLLIRMSDEEKRRIKAGAKRAGYDSTGTWVRELALKKAGAT